MTERLYYTDSYTRAFTATIIKQLTVDGKPAVVLDHTYFYPTGGGQPHDTGKIAGINVVNVMSREGDSAILHVLADSVPPGEVACEIDWERRFDLMQHHTGQHILSQAFVQVADAMTVGFHLSADSVTIDLNRSSISDTLVAQMEDLANRIIWENRPVTARIVDPSDTSGIRMRKLPEHLHTAGLRIIDIDGFDVTACGGTHVAHTGEIGLIKVLRLEKRGDKTRVEFRCGSRALSDYRTKNSLAYQLTAALTVGIDELPAAVQRLQDNLKALQSELKAASQQLLTYEADQILSETPSDNGKRIVSAIFTGRDAGDLRLLASRLTQTVGVLALLATTGDRVHLVFARSADLPTDMNALLKQALTQIEGGKGGGQPALAQGGGIADTEHLQNVIAEVVRSLKDG